MVFKKFSKTGYLAKKRTTLENTAFYQLLPENSDSVGRTFELLAPGENRHIEPGEKRQS